MTRKRCPIISVNQWLTTWDIATWNKNKEQPPKKFFVGSLSLKTLRALSGVRTRTIEDRKARTTGTGYQRTHDDERLSKIGRYVEYGFPLSTAIGLNPEEHPELVNPGWLPTAILVNIIGKGKTRPRKGQDRSVQADHEVHIVRESGATYLDFPDKISIDHDLALPPLEIIDGQHRLLASDTVEGLPDDYEVPIVIFEDLALNWQAYLFWVINVEPKRINTSLAFDLYPDLRDQEWLQRGESVKIYQEHRSQELSEVLWRHSQSPWRDRIELFGKRTEGHVSNAAVIRSLMATFVRPWAKVSVDDDEITRLGGLFGSIDRKGMTYVLRWRRPEQAAFLLLCWTAMRDAVSSTKAEWKRSLADQLRKSEDVATDFAFSGSHTLLATDQGFRAVCFAYNAISQIEYERMGLLNIESEEDESEPTEPAVSRAIASLSKMSNVLGSLNDIAVALAENVDWRTSSAPGISKEVQARQAQYRGSSGYRALNHACLSAVAGAKSKIVSDGARTALDVLGWTDE